MQAPPSRQSANGEELDGRTQPGSRRSSGYIEEEDELSKPEAFKAGFFDKDAETTRMRGIYVKMLVMGSLLTISEWRTVFAISA